jgi:hypothetical protein
VLCVLLLRRLGALATLLACADNVLFVEFSVD